MLPVGTQDGAANPSADHSQIPDNPELSLITPSDSVSNKGRGSRGVRRSIAWGSPGRISEVGPQFQVPEKKQHETA
jgi:hypothetical protein